MLKQRIVTAVALVALLAGALFFVPATYVPAAFAVIVACAGWEWARLMHMGQSAGYLFAAGLLLACWQILIGVPESISIILEISAVFWLLGAPLWFRQKCTLAGNDAFGYGVGILVIIPMWLAMVVLFRASAWLLLAVMAIVWVADISAYFVGRRFGRHKLAPNISPGKTWEGVAGATLGVLVYIAIVMFNTGLMQRYSLILFALIGVAFSVMGDLFESAIKRQAGVKDSGKLLPGHGGLLDRIDALTSTLPLAALVLILTGLA